jgi:hypothetical protein
MQQRSAVLAHVALVLCLAVQLPRCHGHAYLAVSAANIAPLLAWAFCAIYAVALQMHGIYTCMVNLQDPIARNWLHAHQQPTNFYDEVSHTQSLDECWDMADVCP